MKEPKMKRLGVKGMKNTKYLGHFAKDVFMHQGHNLSGQYDLSTGAFGNSKQVNDLISTIKADPSTESGPQQSPNITTAAQGVPVSGIRTKAPGFEGSSDVDANYTTIYRPLQGDEIANKRQADLLANRQQRLRAGLQNDVSDSPYALAGQQRATQDWLNQNGSARDNEFLNTYLNGVYNKRK